MNLTSSQDYFEIMNTSNWFDIVIENESIFTNNFNHEVKDELQNQKNVLQNFEYYVDVQFDFQRNQWIGTKHYSSTSLFTVFR